jgi:hypothetical protein
MQAGRRGRPCGGRLQNLVVVGAQGLLFVLNPDKVPPADVVRSAGPGSGDHHHRHHHHHHHHHEEEEEEEDPTEGHPHERRMARDRQINAVASQRTRSLCRVHETHIHTQDLQHHHEHAPATRRRGRSPRRPR